MITTTERLARPSLAAAPPGAKGTREMLCFRLGNEEYAIDILGVQEIRRFERPTRIAQQHKHCLGVIDLRGTVLPILDVRLRFGLHAAYETGTVVIVVKADKALFGLVVDAVNDVVEIEARQIASAREMGGATRWSTRRFTAWRLWAIGC